MVFRVYRKCAYYRTQPGIPEPATTVSRSCGRERLTHLLRLPASRFTTEKSRKEMVSAGRGDASARNKSGGESTDGCGTVWQPAASMLVQNRASS